MSIRKNCAALALAVMGIACMNSHAQVLFTTQEDFAGWGDNNMNTHFLSMPVASPDSDGSNINGLGNTANAGGAGTAGAEQLTWETAAGGYNFFFSQGEQTNAGFLTALDPGSSASAGTLVSYSGVVKIDTNLPTGSLGLLLNYNSNFSQTFGTAGTANANGYSTYTIPYTINAVSGLNYFQFGIIFNSSFTGTFDFDNIRLGSASMATFSQTNASWVNNGGGPWETATNWSSNPNIPGLSGSQETFGAISGSANPVVTLGQTAVGTVVDFQSANGSASSGYTINNSNAGSLNITSTLEVDSGTHAINVPVTFGAVNIQVEPGASISIPSVSNSGQYGTFYLTANDGVSNGGTFSEGGMTLCSLDIAGTWNFLSSMGTSTNPSSSEEFFTVTVEPGSAMNVNNFVINANQLQGSGTVNIGAGGVLTLGYYNSTTYYDGSFTGSGSLVFTGAVTNTPGAGAAPQYLYADSPSFSGPIVVNFGDTLGIQTKNALGNGSATNTVTLDNGVLQSIGSFTATQNFIITANGGTIDTDGPAGGTGAIIPGGTAISVGSISSTANGTLKKINAGQVTAAKITGVALVINGGTVRLAPNGTSAGASSLNALTLAVNSNNVPQGSLDITNNIVNIAAPSGNDPIAAIVGYLKTGYDNGNWDGAGIQSSSVLTQRGTGIGYADGNTDTGTAAPAGIIVVRDTWLGDLNLDGGVTGADLSTLTANIGHSGAGVDWAHGDLNYDGTVNADDVSLFMLGAADYKAGGSIAVPEPTTIGLLAMGAAAMVRRRRR